MSAAPEGSDEAALRERVAELETRDAERADAELR